MGNNFLNQLKKLNARELHIIPFGGCGEFGMNMTAYILKRKLFIVDAGIMFPDPRTLGVASLIPACSEFFHFYGRVEAYFITHGHEDHIGALPYIFRDWPAPLYASPWTCALIKRKFNEANLDDKLIHEVKPGHIVKAPPLQVKYIHVNHSIPDACALQISSGDQTVVHTGDFKIDATPIGTSPIDLGELEQIGDDGVDLLIADSTNSMSPGPSPSESSVVKPLEECIGRAQGRVFITTFASNLWRLKAVVDVCASLGKRLAISGRGIADCLALGEQQEKFAWPPGVFIELSKIRSIPDNKLVFIISGSQGESRAALSRISRDEHKFLKIQEGDLVIFSARAIPGNEKPILSLIDELRKRKAQIITAKENPAIHVSGHAYAGDLKTFLSLLRPRHYLPVHGTFSHLLANNSIGRDMRYSAKERTQIEDGDILLVNGDQPKVVGTIVAEHNFIDQDSRVELSWDTLRERLRIGELGLAILGGVFSNKLGSFVSGPEISFQGLQLPDYIDEAQWIEATCYKIESRLDSWLEKNSLSEDEFMNQGRLILRRALADVLYKKPVVICKVYFV